MTTVEQGPNLNGLVERVKSILFKPAETWDAIAAEPATVKGLYTGYICILAAIGPVAQLIGSLLFDNLIFHYQPPILGSIAGAISNYILGLIGVFILALVIDGLAPSFGGQKNKLLALKVVAYSFTAIWISQVFALVPPMMPLEIIGLFSLYLFYLGLPKLMKVPEDKAIAYTVVSLVVGAVIIAVILAVSTSFTRMGTTNFASNSPPVGGVVSVGGTSVDLGKLQAASKQLEAAANQAQANPNAPGAVKAVPADTLKGLLPASLASGYARSEVSSGSGGIGGLQGSNAEGVYTKGDARITLSVTDVAAVGALAAMGSAFGVQSDRETATGYEKVHMVGGQMVTESWDNQSKSGKYGVMVANRFSVQADGSGAEMADLKAAVAAVGPDKLGALAKG